MNAEQGDAFVAKEGALLGAPSSTELRETGPKQRRWLSLPKSRLVVNPFNFRTTLWPAEYSNGPSLPLHIGYYVGGKALELSEVLMLFRKPAGRFGGMEVAWEDRFEHSPLAWRTERSLQVEADNGQVELTVSGAYEPWGAIDTWVEVDLDEFPYLEVVVPKAEGLWAVKVNDGTYASDLWLQPETTATGTFTYDIPKETGWRGRKRFLVRFFAVGVGKPVVLGGVRIIGLKERLETATTYKTAWLPHELPFEATYEDGATLVGQDYFYDLNTLVRSFSISEENAGGGTITLAGRYRGNASWDAKHQVLVVETEQYSYAVAIPGGPEAISFYPSYAALLSDDGGQTAPISDAGMWAVDLDTAEIVATVAFATAAEGREVALERALRPVTQGDWPEKRAERRAFWDDYLRRVPQPQSFDLHGVAEHGVTSEEIRRAYYTAWVFLAANVLPAMPEMDYPYIQMATGKPSLWMEGAAKAKASAAWESFFAMQFYAYVDPEASWDAFQGMMSLVDEDGMLGGESLPSRKAQAAMVLYELTGDRDKLAAVYPSLKRYLVWRMQNPRWIFGTHDNPHEKDANFAFSALIDMRYARDIAAALEMPEEVTFWKEKRREFLEACQGWFWPRPFLEPAQYYYADTGLRSRGHTLWIAGGLNDELITGQYLESLRRRFLQDFRPSAAFGGFALPKYPDISYTVYGLLSQGLLKEAKTLANICLRDVVRANMFAEQYHIEDPPRPDGVRPSVFGAATLIDMLWMKNGYRMDKGAPHIVRLPGESGGLTNLSIRGRILNLLMDGEKGEAVIWGSFPGGGREDGRTRLQLELGETAMVSGGKASELR